MTTLEALKYIADYSNYATDSDIRTPDNHIVHVSTFAAEILTAQQPTDKRTVPQAGIDYDPDAPMCQDDYEFLTKTGAYADETPLGIALDDNPID